MKNCGKKLLSLALAAAMSSCMVSAFANTVEITKVEVLSNASDATGMEFTKGENGFENVSLTPDQLLRVTVKLLNGNAAAAGDVTFLSNKADLGTETLGNENIQYVDQQTVGEDGTTTITFRPRTSIGTGAFIAKAGGTEVSAADSLNYEVKSADENMEMTLSSETIEAGGTVTVTLKSGETAVSNAEVKATAAGAADVMGTTDTSGSCTLTLATAGTYTISATAEGYTLKEAKTVAVTPKKTVDPDAAKNAINETFNSITSGSSEVSLSPSATIGEETHNISYEVKTNGKDKIEKTEDNKLKLKEGVFAAKVDITATIDTTSETKTVYLFKDENTTVAFGNLCLLSNTNGADAFKNQTDFQAAINENSAAVTASRAEALNAVLNGINTIDSSVRSAIDLDGNGEVTLSEYRMFKLLLNGDQSFTPEKFEEYRNNANSTNAEG